MYPKSLSEHLMYNTVRLEARDGSSGTGFFYNFDIDNMKVPVLVTNKHVVNYNQDETMKFYLHLIDDNGDSIENVEIEYTPFWIFHPNKDLCICLVQSLFDTIKRKKGKSVYFNPVENPILATSDKLKELSAIEELVMVGYPIGLWDRINNFPIFRRGTTASHPSVDFNVKGIGLVDMACFPGSSGSPIFILNENGYSDKLGNTYIGAQRIMLLGILFSGPTYSARGELIVETIPVNNQNLISETRIMTNLGYYIKATELFEFEEQVREVHKLMFNSKS